MTFELLLSRLRGILREKVKNGQLTERGLARATGVSQPHLHNILKGIRSLPPELADQLLEIAGVRLPYLMDKGDAETSVANDSEPGVYAAFQLREDRLMEPRFQAGDIVYYQRDSPARRDLDPHAAYLVDYNERVLVRYLRMGGQRLYLVSEDSLHDPVRWDYVSLAGGHILEIVRGRIVWICRKVEAPEAGAVEETRRDDRRAG